MRSEDGGAESPPLDGTQPSSRSASTAKRSNPMRSRASSPSRSSRLTSTRRSTASSFVEGAGLRASSFLDHPKSTIRPAIRPLVLPSTYVALLAFWPAPREHAQHDLGRIAGERSREDEPLRGHKKTSLWKRFLGRRGHVTPLGSPVASRSIPTSTVRSLRSSRSRSGAREGAALQTQELADPIRMDGDPLLTNPGPCPGPAARLFVAFVPVRRTSVARGRSTPAQVGRPLEQSQSRAPCSTSAMAPR
jgi:hypothetical protein